MKKWLLLDWGVGGLSVLKALERRHKAFDFVYISDSGSTPYGLMPAKDLKERIGLLFDQAIDRFGVEGFLIACNAASTVFLDDLEYRNRPLMNVISPTLRFLAKTPFRRVGVIGGQRTIHSHVYARVASEERLVHEVVAQPLSALIEQGQVSGAEVHDCLLSILSPFREIPVEALVLACTHYPAASGVIADILPDVKLLDPAEMLATEMTCQSDMLGFRGSFYTTGDCTRTRQSAQRAFGFAIPQVEKLNI